MSDVDFSRDVVPMAEVANETTDPLPKDRPVNGSATDVAPFQEWTMVISLGDRRVEAQ